MQNQSSSARPSFRSPSALNAFRSTYPALHDTRTFASTSTDEAWTSYDGLGPPQHPHHASPASRGGTRGGRGGSGNRANMARNWRQPSPPNSWNQINTDKQRGSKRNKQPNQPPKRPKKSGGTSAVGPPTDREVIDENYLLRTYPELPRDEYKAAPKTLFENPKAFLWDLRSITARSSFASHRNQWYKCTVICTLNGSEQVTAVGEAMMKKDAERVACKHAVLKLHSAGALKMLLSGGLHHAVGNKELLNEEKNAILDVYDYCARFDTTPTVIGRAVTVGRKQNAVEVFINMPEQNISASARAKDRKVAEVLACVEFKKQAEDWHAKHGDEDMVVKDVSSALNNKNGKLFLEYYKIYHVRNSVFDVKTKSMESGGRQWGAVQQGQCYLNDEPLGEPVQIVGKKATAETLAYLTGALALKKMLPEIFPKFVTALKAGNGAILKPLATQWLDVRADQLRSMQDTIRSVRQIGLPPTAAQIEAEEELAEEKRRNRHGPRRSLDPALANIKSKKMLTAYEEYLTSTEIEKIRIQRSELPMNQYTEQVLNQVENNEFSIIVGATGSGKTTQVPQILLENYIKDGRGAECNIICTQPRRIAATSVAARVAAERNEPLQKSIGYHVRFDAKLPLPGGSVTYCTTGILLQQLRHNPDDALDGITHLVIDEVHERDIMIDYLMIVLKRVCKERKITGKPPLKVVLMSATMDTELFAKYFAYKDEEGYNMECPHLSVPGRTFPVKEYFLDDIRQVLETSYNRSELALLNRDQDTRDYMRLEQDFVPISRAVTPTPGAKEEAEEDDGDAAIINWKQEVQLNSSGEVQVSSEKEDALVPIALASTTVAHIAKTTEEGSILVFLPGLDEIQKLEESLLNDRPLGIDFRDPSKFKLYLLHSSIANQNEVFETVPEGVRKIILSTNIAETSITIPDVQYVVDTGKHREKQYEQMRRITALVCTWVSKSNSKQRAGRAGRVQNGNYYALFSRARYDSLRATGLPEMLRSDLQEICLDIKLQGFRDSIGKFLSEAIEPPAPHAIESSLEQLKKLGALTSDEKLTPLGRALATMPVEPSLGKMIILAVIFRCLDPIIILGAASGGRDIFVNPPGLRNEAQAARIRMTDGSGSDHYAVINAYQQWRDIREQRGHVAAMRFAEDNFLHRGALRTLDQTAAQIQGILEEIGIIPRQSGHDRSSLFGDADHNTNSKCIDLVKALTLAGMYPNFAVQQTQKGFRTAGENFTMVHPSSVFYSNRKEDMLPPGTVVAYSSKAKSNDGTSIFLRQNTAGTALMAVLFGGRFQADGNRIQLDDWIPFVAQGMVGNVVTEFRHYLDRLLANAFLSLYRRNGGRSLADDPARETMARGLVDILAEGFPPVRRPNLSRQNSERDLYKAASRTGSGRSSGMGHRHDRDSEQGGSRRFGGNEMSRESSGRGYGRTDSYRPDRPTMMDSWRRGDSNPASRAPSPWRK